MKINSKEDIIKYFNSGCKNNLSIGVENEKFLFDIKSNTRANYDQVKNILIYLKKFGWQEIYEDSNIICLPSHREGLPKALVEAGACSRASVTTNVSGCRNIIINNFNELLFLRI